MTEVEETLIEPESDIKNPQTEGYWWERYFGACACLSDESWLHDANSTVDASKIQVEEGGHVLATVDESGVAYGSDTDEKGTGVPVKMPEKEHVPEAFEDDNEVPKEETIVPAVMNTKKDPPPENLSPAAPPSESTSAAVTPAAAPRAEKVSEVRSEAVVNSGTESNTVPVVTKKAVPPQPAVKKPPQAAANDPEGKPQEMKVDLGEVKHLLKTDGIAFLKHCRDGKIRQRTLVLSDDELKFGWKSKDPKKLIDLRAVTEVRAATTLDPSTLNDPRRPQGMGGTATLRKSSDGPAVGRRAFSFILKDRTIDVECYSEVECKKLCAAFKVMVDKAGGGRG